MKIVIQLLVRRTCALVAASTVHTEVLTLVLTHLTLVYLGTDTVPLFKPFPEVSRSLYGSGEFHKYQNKFEPSSF